MSPARSSPHRLLPWLSALSLLVLTSGCGTEPRNVGGTSSAPKPSEPTSTSSSSTSDSSSVTVAPAKKPAQDTLIVGKTTTDIKASDGTLPPNAKLASQKITAKDPITITGNAYVSMVGQTSILNIKHSMDLYYTANERYPKDLNEFMTEIIKPNNIALARLPDYQEYRYNAATHSLEIWEYPDKKAAPGP